MGLPVEVNNLMLGSLGGYTVGRSLRFRASASAYLSRTPASASNRTTWTISIWLKRGALTSTDVLELFSAASNDQNITRCFFDNSTNQLYFRNVIGNVNTANFATTQVFRDPSAWYHLIIAWDSSQATSTNRVKIYINGTQITAFSSATYPAQNENSWWNAVYTHNISNNPTANRPFDGYLAEVNFIDGQALTPSSFGAYDTNGVWQPKKYSGTYGTNGFYLPFSNTTSTTTLVQDSSGNGNNWTPNNISLTAGTTYDSMIDSPTVSASSSNYAVLNPLDKGSGTISDGNLTFASLGNMVKASIGMSSGKWYWEINNPGSTTLLGISSITDQVGSYVGSGSGGYSYGASNGSKNNNATSVAYGATFGNTDTIGVAFDADAGNLTFYKNNTSQGTAFSSIPAGTYFPALSFNTGGTTSGYVNFGQRPFAYTPPSGFKALNTYNLPAPSIANGAQYMAASLYTGNGGTAQTITNTVDSTSFQPDFVWIKSRNSASFSHRLYDSVRGVGKELYSNATNAESTVAQSLTAFASNGFTLGTDTNNNASGTTYVGWQWKGGGTAVTNNSGTISSQVSANTSAGISIITYTGNGTAGATVGHGLGVAPNLVIWKKRSSTANWFVWSKAADVAAGSTRWGYLNATNAFDTSASTNEYPTYKVDPTSTVLTLNGSGSSNGTNDSSATYVAYCFSAVRGYSAFGSYVGNASSDGPFVFTGFRPKWIMIKNSSYAGTGWRIFDTSRSSYNAATERLWAHSSAAESTASAIDILSNGFKIRDASLTDWFDYNKSGDTMIYMAFAENPFNSSRAR